MRYTGRLHVFLLASLSSLGLASACRSTAPPAPRVLALTSPVPRNSTARDRFARDEVLRAQEATTALTADATLADCVRHALRTNPGLEAARQNWLAELEELPQVRSLPDPVLAARYYIEEVQTRTGPQEWGVGVSQTFPWMGKRGTLAEEATATAEAARARYDARLHATIEDVKRAWFELFYLERSIAAVRANGELLAHLEEVVRTRYASGDASYADLIRAQVERDRLADRLASLEDRRRPLAAHLNRTLHRAPDAVVPARFDVPPYGQLKPTADLRRILDETSPELRVLRNESIASQKAVELARLSAKPNLTFGLDYIATGSADPSSLPGSGDDPLIATLSFNVPLWSARNRAAEREARARHRATSETIGSERDRLLAELESELFRARDAMRQMNLYADSLVPKARQSMEATETAFRSGETGFLDLVEAERLLLEFELNFERARADRGIAIARLERLVGGPVASEVPAPEVQR